MGALTHCYWTNGHPLHTTEADLSQHREETMSRRTKKFDLLYLFQPKDSTVPARHDQPASPLTEACKSILWIGVSCILAAGISQLT